MFLFGHCTSGLAWLGWIHCSIERSLVSQLSALKLKPYSHMNSWVWLVGYTWVSKQGRECPDTKVNATTGKMGQISFTISSCEWPLVGARAPTPPLQLLSPFSYPQWTKWVSHHDVVIPNTKNLVASLKALFNAWACKELPTAFITVIYEREKKNNKLFQLDWYWVISLIFRSLKLSANLVFPSFVRMHCFKSGLKLLKTILNLSM